jgi:hypothetical protein
LRVAVYESLTPGEAVVKGKAQWGQGDEHGDISRNFRADFITLSNGGCTIAPSFEINDLVRSFDTTRKARQAAVLKRFA